MMDASVCVVCTCLCTLPETLVSPIVYQRS